VHQRADQRRPQPGRDYGRPTEQADLGLILEVFVGHVRRENELLLPALANDRRIDLPALLQVMQVRFATYRAAAMG
jgi:hypothetical protein